MSLIHQPTEDTASPAEFKPDTPPIVSPPETPTTETPRHYLSQMPAGSRCLIVKARGHEGFRHRLMELGFVRGEEVGVLKNAPLMDPIEYEIMGSHVSLRRREADNIEVVPLDENAHPDKLYHGTIEEHVRSEATDLRRHITVAILGNPNCGKTQFFNQATGLHEKVSNYSGVTVDAKEGTLTYRDHVLHLVDLPGIYDLTEYSPTEIEVRRFLSEQKPDVVLNLVDAGNLERHLFLTTQLIDLNLRMVMSLNMYDELEQSGDRLDSESLSRMLGFPIVPTVAKTGRGVAEVLDAVVKVYLDTDHRYTKHIHIHYGDMLESCIAKLKAVVEDSPEFKNRYHGRYAAIKLIEGDTMMQRQYAAHPRYEEITAMALRYRQRLEKEYHDDIHAVVSDLKYGFIRGALGETLQRASTDRKDVLYALDTVLTNRWLGFPFLVLFLWAMFQATFTLGAYPQSWLESGIAAFGRLLERLMPAGMFKDLLIDGILNGVGGVLVFLPNLLILFFFISFLEDSGYMARAAFIMDKVMHKIGLHGKSFIPYIIGFGCSVPAIMATRSLENRKDRILTTLTIPFISCSARLPVYLLLVSAFFPKMQGLVLLVIYLLGIVAAVLSAMLLRRLFFQKEDDQFVMELPPYRFPSWQNILSHMWEKSAEYLKKIGTVILVASTLIWALSYFPRLEGSVDSVPVAATSGLSEAQMEQAYIGWVGKFIEPVLRPLGFDWRQGLSLLAGVASKEIVVSTMGILYQDGLDFSPLVALSFLVFILLYSPCVATIAAIAREAGRKWAALSVVYQCTIAWLASFLIFQLGSLLF